jgi:hypothetical protein
MRSAWSTPRQGRFTPGKEIQYPLYRRLSRAQGPRGRVRKVSLPPGIVPRTVQPVAVCYTYWAIPVHLMEACVTFLLVLPTWAEFGLYAGRMNYRKHKYSYNIQDIPKRIKHEDSRMTLLVNDLIMDLNASVCEVLLALYTVQIYTVQVSR